MLNQRAAKKSAHSRGPPTMEELTAQIASIQLDENVPGRIRGFKHIRKNLIRAVSEVRRKHSERIRKHSARAHTHERYGN